MEIILIKNSHNIFNIIDQKVMLDWYQIIICIEKKVFVPRKSIL